MPPKTQKAPKQNLIAALTARNTRERPSFTITNATLPVPEGGYKSVCGTTAPVTAIGSVTPSGSDLLDRFMGQIGCPGDKPSTWTSHKAQYRAQFDKARQCFRGRVDAMSAYTANTEADKDARASHAYAAQAAYTIGRDCLRKIGDVTGAEEAYYDSAMAHIDGAEAIQPGVKAALMGGTDSSFKSAIVANPYLGPLYTKDYGMTPEQWAIYQSFLRFSSLNAATYANTSGRRANAMWAYQAMMNPASVGGGGAAMGGAGTSISITPVNINSALAAKAKGLTLGATKKGKKGKELVDVENALLEKAIAEAEEESKIIANFKKVPSYVEMPILADKYKSMIITALKEHPVTITKETVDNIKKTITIKNIISYIILSGAIYFAVAKITALKIILEDKKVKDKKLLLRKISKFEEYIKSLNSLFANIIARVIMTIPADNIEFRTSLKDFLNVIDEYNNDVMTNLIEVYGTSIYTIGWKDLYPFAADLLDTSDTDESGLLGELVRLYREVRAQL